MLRVDRYVPSTITAQWGFGPMISNLLRAMQGNDASLVPQRVQDDIWRQQDRSEQIISFIQLAIVLIFGALFFIAPQPFEGEVGFELAPWALGLYLVFTVVRLIASYRVRLPGWFLTISVIADMALLMVLRRMGRTDFTAHGFRSSFRDWAAERTNYSREVAEMALGHAVINKVEAAYRRGDLFQKRRRLMDEWARFCRSGAKAGEVVAIRSRQA